MHEQKWTPSATVFIVILCVVNVRVIYETSDFQRFSRAIFAKKCTQGVNELAESRKIHRTVDNYVPSEIELSRKQHSCILIEGSGTLNVLHKLQKFLINGNRYVNQVSCTRERM